MQGLGQPPPGEAGGSQKTKRRLSLWSTGRKDHAPSGEAKFKPEMAQGITDAISTGGNGGKGQNTSAFMQVCECI